MNWETGEEDGSGWKGLAGDEPLVRELEREYERGIESVMSIRCVQHRDVPQINSQKITGAECGECIRRQCWKDMLGLIAKCIEDVPHGTEGREALTALEESLNVTGIGTFGVPDEREAEFARLTSTSVDGG